MVAFAKEHVPVESPARSQNRAECFFARAPGRAGHGAPATRFRAGKNSRCRYDACQGTSLAQESQWSEEDCAGLLAEIDRVRKLSNEVAGDLQDQLSNEVLGEAFSAIHWTVSNGIEIGAQIGGVAKAGYNNFLRGHIAAWGAANGRVMSNYSAVSNAANAQQFVYDRVDDTMAGVIRYGGVYAGEAVMDEIGGGFWGEFKDARNSGADTLRFTRSVTDDLQYDFLQSDVQAGRMMDVYKENCQ